MGKRVEKEVREVAQHGGAANGRAAKPDCLSVRIAARGIHTADDTIAYSSAMVGDIMLGTVTPTIANAAGSQVRNLLKAAELRERFGVKRDPADPAGRKAFQLT